MRPSGAAPLSNLLLVTLGGEAAAGGCSTSGSGPADVVSSQSYRGRENDGDINALVATYPHVVGTRLDDCQTCHAGGEVTDDTDRTSQLNPCTYCHLIPYPDASIVSGAPTDYQGTLNPYGLRYLQAGRSAAALTGIEGEDADGDGFDNATEIDALRYPGDSDSQPGQPAAPIRTFDWNELQSLAAYEQFLLLNSHKQQLDT